MSAPQSSETSDRNAELQGKLLCNVLAVLRLTLLNLQTKRVHTLQDVVHYKQVLENVNQRWQKLPEQALSPRTQGKAHVLFKQVHDLLMDLESKRPVDMPPEVKAIYDELVDLRARLLELKNRPHTISELKFLEGEADKIDFDRLNTGNVFAGDAASVDPKDKTSAGQAICADLLHECYELIEELSTSVTDMHPKVAEICANLAGIRRALLKLRAERSHTMEDLRHWQNMLDAIDSKRQDGIFAGSLKERFIPEGQARAAELLGDGYVLVEQLTETAVDMSPPIKSIHDQLLKHKDHLMDMKNNAHATADVRRIQGQLDKIDNERKDGIFAGDVHHVPPGQAVCSKLLHDCYRLVEECYANAEDADGQEPQRPEHAQPHTAPATDARPVEAAA